MRKTFARDKTQSKQVLLTPFDWKCLTRYSSSLILKITICLAFTNNISRNTNRKIQVLFSLKKIYRSLYKSNWYFKPVSIL